jgi:8-oxo-dGTP pyrophosphatase MutT (NUDIX family)
MPTNGERPARFDGHRYPQVIPEPDDVTFGDPAPWSTLGASARSGLSLDVVQLKLRLADRLLLNQPLSEEPDNISLVADALPVPITGRAAVLVALFEEDGETHVILTRRALSLRLHGGEIALPGGRSEDDESPVETALREAYEEIGLDSSQVEPVAWLSPIMTFAAGSSIWPIVGIVNGRPALRIDPSEVDRVFTVTLAELVAEGAFIEERWRREPPHPFADGDGYFPIRFFKVPGDIVWGATARILSELLVIVTGAFGSVEHGLDGQSS